MSKRYHISKENMSGKSSLSIPQLMQFCIEHGDTDPNVWQNLRSSSTYSLNEGLLKITHPEQGSVERHLRSLTDPVEYVWQVLAGNDADLLAEYRAKREVQVGLFAHGYTADKGSTIFDLILKRDHDILWNRTDSDEYLGMMQNDCYLVIESRGPIMLASPELFAGAVMQTTKNKGALVVLSQSGEP